MSFVLTDSNTGATVSKFSKFRKPTANGGGNNNFNSFPQDRLVKALEVHPASNGEGYLIVEDLGNGKKYNVVVSQETFQRQKARPTSTADSKLHTMRSIYGGLIDDKYEDAVKQSPYFVLTQTKFVKKHEVVNGEQVYFISTEWIRHITEYNPTKQFYGILTASSFNPYTDEFVQTIQVWDEQGIPLNGSDTSSEALEKEYKLLDKIEQEMEEAKRIREEAKEKGQKAVVSYPTRRGFQVRTFRVTEETNEKGEKVTVNTLIDSYRPLLMEEPMQDSLGNITKNAKILSGEWFIDFLSKYAEYAYNRFTEQEKGSFDLENDVFPKDVLVEVCMFNSFMCNTNEDNRLNNLDPNAAKPKFPTPYQRMTQKETKPSDDSDESEYYLGMNLAVHGIITLSNDEVNMSTREFIERNYVRRAFVSGRKMNVHFFVKASNGGRVKISDKLRTQAELEAMKGGFNPMKPETLEVTSSVPTELSDDFI